MKINSVSPSVSNPYTSETATPQRRVENSVDYTKTSGEAPVAATLHHDHTEGNQPIESLEGDSVINEELLKNSVDQANKSLLMYNKYIERSIHPVTKAVVYKLKDSNTEEVISEFPPQKIQDMIAKMWELAGLFIDERA